MNSSSSSSNIHPTAVIDPSSELGAGVQVGAYAVIAPHCVIGAETVIGPQVVIEEFTHLGTGCQVRAGAVLGGPPQDNKFKGERSYLKIGNNNAIREFVTLHRATGEEAETVIGDDNLIMAYVHIGHNCQIGSGVHARHSDADHAVDRQVMLDEPLCQSLDKVGLRVAGQMKDVE